MNISSNFMPEATFSKSICIKKVGPIDSSHPTPPRGFDRQRMRVAREEEAIRKSVNHPWCCDYLLTKR